MDADAEPGEKGQFDVVLDGRTIFSKYETGRFPEEDEILGLLV
jgi:selT/selW/selH-like putative selenoprotein